MGFLAAFVRVYVLRSSSKLHPQRVPVRHAAPSSIIYGFAQQVQPIVVAGEEDTQYTLAALSAYSLIIIKKEYGIPAIASWSQLGDRRGKATREH